MSERAYERENKTVLCFFFQGGGDIGQEKKCFIRIYSEETRRFPWQSYLFVFPRAETNGVRTPARL